VAWPFFSRAAWRPRPIKRAPEAWPPELRTALAELERLVATRPDRASPAQTLSSVLVAAFGDSERDSAPSLDRIQCESFALEECVKATWAEERPAFTGIMPRLDAMSFVRRILAICDAARGDDAAEVDHFRMAIERRPERVLDWVDISLSMPADRAERAVGDLGLEPALVESILRLALLPVLAAWSKWICSRLSAGDWSHGHCPVCGSAPALAESRGLEQRRHFRCDRCAADWPSKHFICPYCETVDHRALRYLHVAGEQDRCRLAICNHCGGRFKVVATLGPLSPPGLLVAELALVHLDLVVDPLQPGSP
jgi:hypothetical protein